MGLPPLASELFSVRPVRPVCAFAIKYDGANIPPHPIQNLWMRCCLKYVDYWPSSTVFQSSATQHVHEASVNVHWIVIVLIQHDDVCSLQPPLPTCVCLSIAVMVSRSLTAHVIESYKERDKTGNVKTGHVTWQNWPITNARAILVGSPVHAVPAYKSCDTDDVVLLSRKCRLN